MTDQEIINAIEALAKVIEVNSKYGIINQKIVEQANEKIKELMKSL